MRLPSPLETATTSFKETGLLSLSFMTIIGDDEGLDSELEAAPGISFWGGSAPLTPKVEQENQ